MRGIEAVQFAYKLLGEWSLELVCDDKMLKEKSRKDWVADFDGFLKRRTLQETASEDKTGDYFGEDK